MSKARQYCQKAIETNPDYGAPYILIGNMYAKSAKSIYPNDAVLAKAVTMQLSINLKRQDR